MLQPRGHAAVCVVMAVLMAAWSPLWCCCWLRGGLDLLIGRPDRAARCVAEVADAAMPASGCPLCAANSAGEAGAAGSAESAPSRFASDSATPSDDRPRDGDRTCRCHDQGRDVVRDAGGMTLVWMAAELPPPLAVVAQRAAPRHGTGSSPGCVGRSPPTTLVRLHTLLLI